MSAATNTTLNAEILPIVNSEDIARLLEIELESFEFPWSEYDFDLTLREQHTYGRKIQIYHIDKPLIVGYVIYKLHQHSIQILNLAVASKYRRQGMAFCLLEYVYSKLGGGRRFKLEISVRESNLAAQLLLRKNGFRVRKICREYYPDILEDSYLFSKSVSN